MISFRFQMVALTSITVALAGGLVVGELALRGSGAGPARDQARSLDLRNQQLQAQVGGLTRTATGASARSAELVNQLAPQVLDARLAGIPVLILSTSDGAAAVPGVARMLGLAGAIETGRLRLTDNFTDPADADELLDLATAALPPSVSLGLPVSTDGVLASSVLLADVLLARTPSVTADDRRSVLAAYASQGYLVADHPVTGPAGAVVLVTGAGATGSDGAVRTGALATLVGQLAQAGPLVVGSDGVAATPVAQVRADTRLAPKVSTVDNISTAQGQLVCVWALADELGGRVGHYGNGPGAARLPPLTPPPHSSTAGSPTPGGPTPGSSSASGVMASSSPTPNPSAGG